MPVYKLPSSAVKGFRAFVMLALLGACSTVQSWSQEIPAFGTEVNNSSLQTYYGLAMAQYQNGLAGTALVLAYPDGSGILNAAYSTDGQNFNPLGQVRTVNGQAFTLLCNDGSATETCTPAMAVYKGVLYIAFAQQSTGNLYVLSATPMQNSAAYIFNLVYEDTAINLTSAPAMVVSPNGANLLIRYGTSNIAKQSNATFVTSFDGTNWSRTASGGFAPTQSAMVVLNGKLFVIDRQNSSADGMFVSQVDNNGIQIAGTVNQIPGVIVRHGFQGVNFKNSIVLAVQANDPQKSFYIFSSLDGLNWANHLYPSSTGNAPQLALFGSGVSEAHQENGSPYTIFSSFTTQ